MDPGVAVGQCRCGGIPVATVGPAHGADNYAPHVVPPILGISDVDLEKIGREKDCVSAAQPSISQFSHSE